MSFSPLKALIDRELEKYETTFNEFIESGGDSGKSIRQLATELENLTGIEVSWRTIYRWLNTEKRAAS